MPPPVDPQRRARLLALKLAALVRDHTADPVDGAPAPLPGGAALVHAGEAWVLAEDAPARFLGPALAWARQQGAAALHVLAEHDTGLLARRAAGFTDRPHVWRIDGRRLQPAEPVPLPAVPALDPRFAALVPLVEAGGAEPVVEHGVLAGEVAGLEVCRAVHDPDTGAVRLEVGVGAHDREAFTLIHGDVPPVEALADVVAKVRPHRTPGAAPHPLNRLGVERLLRWRLVRDPSLVSARRLEPVAPPVPRANVKDAVPCVAAGEDADGTPLAVVCSAGVDLDLVPFAADVRLAAPAGTRVVLALPERDAVGVTRALAAALRQPAEVRTVEPA